MKPKSNTYYSNVILKESSYKKRQRKILNFERLSDEKIYMKAKFDAMYNKHNSKRKEKLPKFGENPVVYNCYLTWTEFWNAWEVHKRKNKAWETKYRLLIICNFYAFVFVFIININNLTIFYIIKNYIYNFIIQYIITK